MFCKTGALRNFVKFTGKQLYQSLLFNGADVFLWILWNFLEHLFLQNISGGCFWNWGQKQKSNKNGIFSLQYKHNFRIRLKRHEIVKFRNRGSAMYGWPCMGHTWLTIHWWTSFDLKFYTDRFLRKNHICIEN